MSALRASRAALRARSALTKNSIQKRGYADAVSDKIKLSLALPHQVRLRRRSLPEVDRGFRLRTMGIGANMRHYRQYINLQMCTDYSSTVFLTQPNSN